MRNYARVAPQFWTGNTGKALRKDRDAQVLALYLMTCPAANMIGLYYLPLPVICHETGSPLQGARKALRRLSEGGFCLYNEVTEYVWIPEMARFQIGETLKPGDKQIAGIKLELQKHMQSGFAYKFIEKYNGIYCLKIEAPPKTLPRPSEAPPKPVTVTGAVTGTVTGDKDYAESCEKSTALPPTPKIEFGVQGFENITNKDRELWHKAYPAIDLDTELAKMEAWVVANPKNRKSNWHKFICNWFSRAQDKAPGTKRITWKDVEAREKELARKKREDNKPIVQLAPIVREGAETLREKFDHKAEDCTNPKKADCQSPYCKPMCRFRGVTQEAKKVLGIGEEKK